MSSIENARSSRPRVTLMIPDQQTSFQEAAVRPNVTFTQPPLMQHSPYIMSAATSGPSQGQPNWPNPIVQQLYAQRAGDFVCKQFEGLNRFTKSGLSVGEKSVVWLYAKFRSWSRKWFTHCFLFIVVLLYSIAGSLVFMTLEGNSGDSIPYRACVREKENIVTFTHCLYPHWKLGSQVESDSSLEMIQNPNHNLIWNVPQFHAAVLIKITTRHFVSCAMTLGGSASHVWKQTWTWRMMKKEEI